MANMGGLLRKPSGGTTRTGAKWWPRKIMRTDGYTPFEIYGNNNADVIGYVWINNATLVGSGGTAFTVTSGTTTITITE